MSLISTATLFSKQLQNTLMPLCNAHQSLSVSPMGDLVISLHFTKKPPTTYVVSPQVDFKTLSIKQVEITTPTNKTRGKARHMTVKQRLSASFSKDSILAMYIAELMAQPSDGTLAETELNYRRIGHYYTKKATTKTTTLDMPLAA